MSNKLIHTLKKETSDNSPDELISALSGYGNIIIWMLDQEHKVIYYNNAFVNYIAWHSTTDHNSVFRGDDVQKIPAKDLWPSLYAKGFIGRAVQEIINLPDGRWIKICIVPIHKEGKVTALACWGSETTDEMEARLSLKKSEQKFRNIFESLQDVYFRCKIEGDIVTVSPSVKKIGGYSPEELEGKDITNYYLYSVTTKNILKRLIRAGELKNIEIAVIHKQGKIIPSLCSLKMIREDNEWFVEGIMRDIAEIKQTNEELEHAIELAEASLQVKEKFLANMSHEIRTPLNGIIGMVNVLERTSLSHEQSEQVQAIKQSSDILLKLLNNLLDWSKLKAGRMSVQFSPVTIKEIIEKVVLIYNQKAIEKDISLSYAIGEGLNILILTDEVKLIQIISNLVSNAIKFTGNNGSVYINASLAASLNNNIKVKCEVRDTGPGINEEEKVKLFRSFTQLDSSENKQYHGVGLGLTISKELVHLLGGEIGVESTQGTGSNFWFTFKSELAGIDHKKEQKIVRLEKFEDAHRILIVDDNKINLDIAAAILSNAGAEVDKARSGKEAMELMLKEKYSVVLLDIQMPGMSGLEVMEWIHEAVNDVPPVIALTAYSSNEEKNKYLSRGFDDFISKPIVPEELILKVDEWSSAREMIVDTTVLDKLVSFGGDKIVEEAMNDFYIETKKQIKECFVSLSDNNHKKILDILHAINGNAGTLGVKKVARCAAQIEKQLKKGYISRLESELKELEYYFIEFKNHYFGKQ